MQNPNALTVLGKNLRQSYGFCGQVRAILKSESSYPGAPFADATYRRASP